MNPFSTRIGVTIVGFIFAIFAIFIFDISSQVSFYNMTVWTHVIVGIAWIGLLYYFNFIQVPAVNEALKNENPSPAAINKYVAPRALFWFRWAAVATWVSGLYALDNLSPGNGIIAAFTFQQGYAFIGMGAWLGTIMLFNVWVLIWPNQRKILGLDNKTHSKEKIASAKFIALMASRSNTALSVPMLLAMTGFGHGLGV